MQQFSLTNSWEFDLAELKPLNHTVSHKAHLRPHHILSRSEQGILTFTPHKETVLAGSFALHPHLQNVPTMQLKHAMDCTSSTLKLTVTPRGEIDRANG